MSLPPIHLPDRPLSLERGVLSTPSAYIWATPVILALTVFLFVWEAPGVFRDFRISQNPLPLEDGDVRDGRCTTRRAIFTDCRARLVYTYGGQSFDTQVEVMFVDLHLGDYETGLVISADHPELATISLGLDKLWNRIITLTAFVVILGGMSLAMICLGLRILRAKGQLRHPALLTLAPVEITAFDRRRGVLSITYNDTIAADRTKRSAYTRMTNGREPLIIGEAAGKPVGLAVRHGRAALPVLLDDRLQRIDLTDEERDRALAPFTAARDGGQDRPVLADAPKRGVSLLKRLMIVLSVLLLMVVGVFGFWLWYVTRSSTQFQSPGMDINNLMPRSLNAWGCAQLKQRFGADRAPFGCTAADYTSWK